MVSASRMAHSIEVTAEGLQEEMARLHFQKQALERELVAIVAHLGSVQRALGALESALVAPRAADQVDAHGQQYGKLTEQIVAYFAEVGDAEVRAREVAAALGRDDDSGSINAVRSTLDRLVASSRIERAGRGLYRTGRS
ncbi:hypothetical protein ABZT06_07305 [Streptomyces sp. NPDC005483]|uniref:hypothetical protein n=1 Tax=Streptomyces sp. NPDC005483 TaxID=3154882 RepID=UPI0033A5E730